MAFWKEQLRADHQWINHSWVPPIKDHNNRDRISELPDSILLHILNFMNTKSAVQTCVLSKRWKDLCKRLISLAYCPDPYLLKKRGVGRFMKFATWVLSRRDDAYSLLNLTLHLCWTEPELLDKVTKYALLHDVRQLTMELYSGFRPDLESLPLIFCCHSLTSLKLCINGMNYPLIILPKSLHLPALKSLHLQGFNFTATGNDSAEPFSNCYVLNTLVLRFCSLHNDARVLCISNSTLSILTILEGQTYQIVLSTPNLSSFTIRGSSSLQLFSTCNLSFLGEVNIDVSWDGHWAEKSSIISSNIDFSNPISMRPEPPSFVRLESLKVIKLLSANVSDEKVNTVVEYLLRDSPMARRRGKRGKSSPICFLKASMEPKAIVFEPGSAVYFIIYGGSWFSGTIIGCVDSDRFLVQYRRNSVESTVVSLHQLRPLPPPESHREFKSGDKVEVFHDHRWRDGHVTADLVNGRFVVSFRDSEEMMLPKEQLRDRISELPDTVLLHILNFMDTKDAVKTSVLFNRWKNFCKALSLGYSVP
ncbi:hypothetical protein JHK87_024910 [Glycine soja]|nr:hypothetical protein JHK87_024910 [Glycine soja]